MPGISRKEKPTKKPLRVFFAATSASFQVAAMKARQHVIVDLPSRHTIWVAGWRVSGIR